MSFHEIPGPVACGLNRDVVRCLKTRFALHFYLFSCSRGFGVLGFWGNELTLHKSEHKLDNERHDVDMGNVSVPHFGVHLSRKDFDALKQRLKDSGTKYYDEPYLRFKGTKYEQETFFVKDPNENILEIKTLTANPE